MSEPTAQTADPAAPEGEPAPQEPAAYTPPATQADLDRIIADRVNRTKNQFKDYADLKAKATELDTIRAAQQTAEERQAQELTRWQSEAETWRATAVASRIEALAAAEFADPSDAASNLDPAKYLGAGGEIDQAAIKADLADLLARKPHYRRPDGEAGPRLPAPNQAQGNGGGTATPNPGAEFAAILQGQMNGSR